MVYKWYILPIGGLYATYHLLGEPFQQPLILVMTRQHPTSMGEVDLVTWFRVINSGDAADLSPLHVRKTKLQMIPTDGNIGETQGLALIQGQIYKPCKHIDVFPTTNSQMNGGIPRGSICCLNKNKKNDGIF